MANTLPPITDPDPLLSCDLMDGRDAFLTLARDKHWEFSSLRRCKWSTMCMLVELHNQGQDRFVYTCNECKHHVETRWHCTVCEVVAYCYNYLSYDWRKKLIDMFLGLVFGQRHIWYPIKFIIKTLVCHNSALFKNIDRNIALIFSENILIFSENISILQFAKVCWEHRKHHLSSHCFSYWKASEIWNS